MSDKHGNAEQTIFTATDSYEAWLRTCTQVNDKDLQAKHDLLAEGTFPFLRGRFTVGCSSGPSCARTWPRARQTLAVGDLHVENFGTLARCLRGG